MQIFNGSTPRVPILMVDATDDETAETGLTVQVFISKNGAAVTSVINGFAEVGQGLYYASLTAAETNTDGFIFVIATASGADVWRDYHEVVSLAATPSGAASRAELVDSIWGRDISATPTAAGLAGLMLAQIYATVSTGPMATVTGVVNSVSVTTITGVNNSVGIRSGTTGNVLNIANGRVGINWTDIANATGTQGFTLTTLGTVSNVATANFVASVASVVLTNVATVTGVTNSVTANVGTVTGVTNSVSANVGTISGVTNRVDATLTTGFQGMLADRILSRNLARGSDGTRTVQDAFRLLRNRRGLTFGAMQTATLTSFLEDDVTPAWTAIVGTSSAVGLTDIDAS